MTQFITYGQPNPPFLFNNGGEAIPCPTLGTDNSTTENPELNPTLGSGTPYGWQCIYTLPDNDNNMNIIKDFIFMSTIKDTWGCSSGSGPCNSGWELDGSNFKNILAPHFCKIDSTQSYCSTTQSAINFFKKWMWWIFFIVLIIALLVIFLIYKRM